MAKKKHTIKNTIISSVDFVILYVGTTFSGSNHDYGMFKEEFDPSLNWFSVFNIIVDLGYLGFDSDFQTNSFEIPHKKPRKSKNNLNPYLTEDQKAENRKMSGDRVVVENSIGGMKRFRCISDRYRNRIINLKDLFVLLSAGLWNLNIECRK